MARGASDLFIVGLNIDKHEGYQGRRAGRLVQLTHGIYMDAAADPVECFKTYGVRIAQTKFREAAITHSCAHYRAPIELDIDDVPESLTVFIGGDFPYKWETSVSPSDGGAPLAVRVIQSAVKPDYSNEAFYELVKFKDPIGAFEMYVSTPELTAIHMMEASKKHPEKRLAGADMEDFLLKLLARHRRDPFAALKAIGNVADMCDRRKDFDRFNKHLFPQMRDLAG